MLRGRIHLDVSVIHYHPKAPQQKQRQSEADEIRLWKDQEEMDED